MPVPVDVQPGFQWLSDFTPQIYAQPLWLPQSCTVHCAASVPIHARSTNPDRRFQFGLGRGA